MAYLPRRPRAPPGRNHAAVGHGRPPGGRWCDSRDLARGLERAPRGLGREVGGGGVSDTTTRLVAERRAALHDELIELALNGISHRVRQAGNRLVRPGQTGTGPAEAGIVSRHRGAELDDPVGRQRRRAYRADPGKQRRDPEVRKPPPPGDLTPVPAPRPTTPPTTDPHPVHSPP